MIVYNETIIVDDAIYDEWLKWMEDVHIPAVMATGYFNSYRVLHVIDSPNPGFTTCIQYNTDTQEKFNQFYAEHLHHLHAAHQQRYDTQFVMYNTLMERIGEG